MAHLDLTDDQRYRALKSRDGRFDGIFIVGVRTTGIYCRPSCPTPVHPLRKNVDFFATAAAAQRSGLRACKRCRPDASPGSPEWNLRNDVVARAMQKINGGYLDEHSVADLARDLAVTERHLRRIVIDAVGAPPVAIAPLFVSGMWPLRPPSPAFANSTTRSRRSSTQRQPRCEVKGRA